MNRIRRRLSRRRQSSSSNRTSLSSSGKNRNTTSHHLVLISDTQDFDRTVIRRLEAEGFNTRYIPFVGTRKDIERDRKDVENLLNELEDDLESGERYAVIAYNLPAYLLLYSHHQSMTTTNPLPRLCALIAYYPSIPDYLPRNNSLFPCEPPSTASTGVSTYSANPLLPLQIHLASQQSPNLYDNYSLHPDWKRHRCHIFAYPDSHTGFAEHSSHTYDRIDAQLAWSRALDCIKRGFGPGGSSWTVSDIEAMWEGYWRRLKDNHSRGTTGQALNGNDGEPEDFFHYNPNDHEGGPSVNCIPSNVRAVGSHTSLRIFHVTTFFPKGPSSQSLRLLTRTVGPDRIIDEALLSFSHSAPIPWLLPGVPPSNRHVQIPLILVGSFCAAGMARLNLYWDQASVLVQIGVLDPGTGLPVVAKEEVEGIIG